MSNHNILIDGNNLGFAGMANPKLSAGEKNTQATFAVIQRIRNIYLDHPDSRIIVLWDGKSWRKDFYTEYKANREKTEQQQKDRSLYYEQAQDIKKGLDVLGVCQISAANQEADDLAYFLSKKLNSIGDRVTLLTADRDWIQLVNEHTSWIDLIHGKRCDFYNFQEITGYDNPNSYIEAKALQGDISDNIKGYNGLGPKTLEKIYYENDSVYNLVAPGFDIDTWWKHMHGGNVPKIVKEMTIQKLASVLDHNMPLMKLGHKANPGIIGLKKRQQHFDRKAFEDFCYENSFHSIINRLNKFLQPFEDNKYVIKQFSE